MVEEADQIAQADQAVVVAFRQRLAAEDLHSWATLAGSGANGSQTGRIETETGMGAKPAGNEVGCVEWL